MTAMYVSAAAALVLAGVAIGILVVVCLGIKRDDRPAGFPADTHDRTARAARKMTGASIRRPEPAVPPTEHPAGLADPWRLPRRGSLTRT
jgi:hypothetical protein